VRFDAGDFSEVTFPAGCQVSFREAEFSSGTIDFDGAKFSGATVDFRKGKFTGAIVDFHNAEFSGEKVDFHDTLLLHAVDVQDSRIQAPEAVGRQHV